jgi:hypothetical protein
VQGITADKLDIKRNHLPFERMAADGDFLAAKPPASVFDNCESFVENFVQAAGEFLFILDFGKLLFPFGSFLTEGLFGNLLQLGFERVNLVHAGAEPLDFALIFRADKFFNDITNHGC